jgi:tryptophanyl-tRNA synthetase
MSPRPPAIAEGHEPGSSIGVAREQKITPFDVEGGVDEEGRSLGM